MSRERARDGNFWRATRLAALVCALGIGHASPASAGSPDRVVSINLCTDQYLLALADPHQIAGLTHLAANRQMSALAESAEGHETTRGLAEEVMALAPDLVLSGTYTKRATRLMLKRLGYTVIEVPTAHTFEEVREAIRQVAEALGKPERGRRLIAEIDRRLADGLAEAGRPPEEEAPTALHLQRRGYATGSGTLIDALFQALGLRNLAAELGISGVRRVSLEDVVREAPEILVVDQAPDDALDVSGDALGHPALVRTLGHEPYVLPQRLTVCGGAGLPQAVAELGRQLRAAEARPSP